MTTDDPHEERDNDAREASKRRASTSIDYPTNMTRSTQDLTIGGSEKQAEPQAGASARGDELLHASPPDEKTSPPSPQPTEQRGEQSGDGVWSAEHAVENQERALESGGESPV
jgi:hypothetical protein